ncbi:MAG: protease complex subunit PrcB family protein [Bacteroidota bacterium]
MTNLTYYFCIGICFLFACKSQKQTESGSNTQTDVRLVESIPSTASNLDFELIQDGMYCGYNETGDLLIQDADAWKSLWSKVGSNQIPPPDLPVVDFSTHMVLASFMGPQNSGGYALKISKVQSDNNTAYVTVSHRKPGPECFVTDAITQPYCIVTIKRENINTAAFLIKEEVNDC